MSKELGDVLRDAVAAAAAHGAEVLVTNQGEISIKPRNKRSERNRRYYSKRLKTSETVLKRLNPDAPKGTWKQSLHHDSAHFVTNGQAACGARIPEGSLWHDHSHLRRCTRCMPKAK